MRKFSISQDFRTSLVMSGFRHRGVKRIGVATIALLIALSPSTVRSDTLCDKATKAALEKALEHILGKGVEPALAITDSLQDYLTNPDDTKFNKAMNTLANGALGVALPQSGLVMVAGKLTVGSVEYTIDTAKALQLDGYLCNGGGLIETSFFQYGDVQTIWPGINCDNYADKITTLQDFAKLEEKFKKYKEYELNKGPIKAGGDENVKSYKTIFDEEWEIMARNWQIKVGAALVEKLRADLIREAEAFKANQACKVDPKVGTTEPKISDGDAPLIVKGAAGLIWEMALSGKIYVEGSVEGDYGSFHFAGKIIEPAQWSGTVACNGVGTGIAENSGGIFAATIKCETVMKSEGSDKSSKWTADSGGYVNYDGWILKGLGKGTRTDSGVGGESFSDLGLELKIQALAPK